jgi:hypothetical protein
MMKPFATLKNILLTTSAFFAAACLIMACTKDTPLKYNGTIIEKCLNVVCYNGGTCVDGLCQCPEGFEGSDCKSLWNSRYVGTYDAFDECAPGASYVVTVAPLVNKANGIVLRNIGSVCLQQELVADITKEKTNIVVPLQKACNNLYISGTGSQTNNGSFINMWLTARDTVLHTSQYCTIVLRKK